jgi:hypothetical protein
MRHVWIAAGGLLLPVSGLSAENSQDYNSQEAVAEYIQCVKEAKVRLAAELASHAANALANWSANEAECQLKMDEAVREGLQRQMLKP